ncbi:hypothetical protein HDU93_007193 [Gonapodya sp. JEL0774]|nr:hypothetical protein HDU93_007193 [Gonapodya sp. JEL0774]
MAKELARYWELGWVAFPISLKWNDTREKKELIPPKDWQKLTVTSAQNLPPRNAVAIQTGGSSGIVVVDVDNVDGWQQILVQEGESAPETVTARSQRGGYHYYFQRSEKVADLKSTSALLGGCVDVRNQGGMIIAPPSAFQVPGESTPRTYSWFEGKSPWDRDLAEMPAWLENALRTSGGGTRNVSASGFALDDVVNTPEIVKDFILEHFGIVPAWIGGTKYLESGGYAVSTTILDCCFKKAAHRSNHQYLYVSAKGEMSRRCHGGGCREKRWGVCTVPESVGRALKSLFPSKQIVDPQLVELACKEAVLHVNDTISGNANMAMALKRDSSGFEGPLTQFYDRECCFVCGKGALVATTSCVGLVIACDNRSCSFKLPETGEGISIQTQKYANLGKFFAIIQQLNVANSTYDYESGSAVEMPSLFLGDEVVVRENAEYNTLILDALDGSDSSLAGLFAYIHRGKIVFASEDRWYIFRGHRWVCRKMHSLTKLIDDPLTSEFRLTLTAALAAYKNSSVKDKEAKVKRIMLTLQSMKSDSKQSLIFSQCRKEGLLGDVEGKFLDKLDSNPLLLGFENGVYDLSTHTFRAGKPEDFLTMSVGYDFDPTLMGRVDTRREVEEFFSQVFPDPDVRRYVLLFLTSALEGYNKEHRFHFAHGSSGRNGKGVLMKIMECALGKYAVSVNSALICGKSSDANSATPQLSLMANKRFAYMSEVEAGARINEELFKRLSGGDRLQTRRLYEEMREVDNTTKMLMCCNDLPKIDGSKQANVPRIVIIPFVSRFKEGPCDPLKIEYPVDRTLEARVDGWKQVMMGILLEFHKVYSREGLGQLPAVMKRVKVEYLGANDPNSLLEQYVRERLVSEGEGVGSEDLLTDYRRWEKDMGVTHPQSAKTRVMIQLFDKLLISEDRLRKKDDIEKGSNVRRYGRERKAGYAGWTLRIEGMSRSKGSRAVTSMIAENVSHAEWTLETRTNVHNAVKERDWMNNVPASILSGVVAEAQVKNHLCKGVYSDWRQLIHQNTQVSTATRADMLSCFTERECSVLAAVQKIKELTDLHCWEAPTSNFRMVTTNRGEVTGRVDFHGRSGSTMYILETKFSASDLTPGNRHCRQMELYWQWGVAQLGVEKCLMLFYNIRTGVLEMGSFQS